MTTSPGVALRHARNRRERAAIDNAEATLRLRLAIREAAEAGLPKTEIAELAGVTRQTVYDILERNPRVGQK